MKYCRNEASPIHYMNCNTVSLKACLISNELAHDKWLESLPRIGRPGFDSLDRARPKDFKSCIHSFPASALKMG